MSQKIKKILITAAHFSEIRGFWEALGFEKRDLKGKPATFSRFDKEITLVIVGIGYKKGSLPVSEFLKSLSLTDLVLNVGSAGSLYPGLDPGDCFIPDTFIHEGEEEYFKTVQLKTPAHAKKILNILNDKEINFKSGALLTVNEGVESSGTAEKLRTSYNASAVDMEAYYLAEAASQNNIPFASLKIISDRADGSTQLDFKKSLPTVSAKIRCILTQLIKEI